MASPSKPRPFRQGESVSNEDGSISTERSITVTDPKLNSGKPTNIPSLFMVDGKPKQFSQKGAIKAALESGVKFRSFNTIDEAVDAAVKRSKAGGASRSPDAEDEVSITLRRKTPSILPVAPPREEELMQPLEGRATVLPQKAAENIKDAGPLEISPDVVETFDEPTRAEVKDVGPPKTVPFAVQRLMNKSNQHASIVLQGNKGEDLKQLNLAERIWRHTTDSITRSDNFRVIHKLSYRLAQGNKLTGQEKVDLIRARESNARLTIDAPPDEPGVIGVDPRIQAKSLDLNWFSALPGDVAAVGAGLIDALQDGAWITAVGAGISGGLVGALGAVGGFALGGVPGAIRGGLTGFRIGAQAGAAFATTFISIPWDIWEQSVGGIYDELGSTPLGQDKSALGESKRRSLAKGGGFLMTLVGGYIGFKIAKKIPYLRKVLGGKKELAKALNGPLNKKWLSLIQRIGESIGQSPVVKSKGVQLAKRLSQTPAGLEIIEEDIQEMIQIVTKGLGDSWDGSETSFIESVDKSLTIANAKRLARTALIAGVAGETFVRGAKIATIPLEKLEERKRAKVEAVRADREARAKDPTPRDPSDPTTDPTIDILIHPEFTGDIPSDLVGDEKTLSPDEQGINALKFADVLEDTAAKIKSTEANELIPDDVDTAVDEMMNNAGISHVYAEGDQLTEWADSDEKSADVAELLGESQVAEHELNAPMRVDNAKAIRFIGKHPESASHLFKMAPESPTAKQYKDRVESRPADAPKVTQEDAFGEEPYLDKTDDKELQDSKQEVVDTVNDDPEANVLSDLESQQQDELNTQIEKAGVEGEENISLVEDYLDNSKVMGPLTETQQKRKDKGLPLHTINPESLTDELKIIYLDDPVLKKRKIFSKDGLDGQHVAGLHDKGLASFLKILSTSPTRDQLAKNVKRRLKAAKAVESKAAKAYRKLTNSYLLTMSKIIKKFEVDYRLPILNVLANKARDIVGNLRLRDLNVNQSKMGERRSHTNSKSLIAERDLVEALDEEAKAAQNSEISREVHRVILKINQAFKNIAKMSSPEIRAILEQGGRIYINAINALMDFYNLGTVDGAEIKVDAFNKLVDKMKQEGRGDFAITDAALDLAGISPQESIMDMTVDGILTLDNLLKRIVKQASLENTLLSNELDMQNTTIELISNEGRDDLSKHREFDLSKKTIPVLGPSATKKKFWSAARWIDSYQNTLPFIVLRLDAGIFGGFHARHIWQPMIQGFNAKVKLQGEFKAKFDALIKIYDKGDVLSSTFRSLGVRKMDIPEFRKFDSLSNGILVKSEVFMILANMGNPENKKAVGNFGISPARMLKILETHLEKRDFDLVQGMWNLNKELFPKIEALEKLSTDVPLVFVEPESFEAFGQTYDGGHLRIRFKTESDERAIRALMEDVNQLGDPTNSHARKLTVDDPYLGVVRRPNVVRRVHLKERVGSKDHLDLNMEGFTLSLEDMLHDLAMRIPVRDTMTLLANKTYSDAIKSVVGVFDYNVMVNTVAEQTHSLGSRNMRLHGALQARTDKVLSGLRTGFVVSRIVFSKASLIMSALTIPQLIKQMGPRGLYYLQKASIAVDSHRLFGLTKKGPNPIAELVSEFDPSLRNHRLGLDGTDSSSMANSTPKKRRLANRGWNYFANFSERSVELSLNTILGGIDYEYKIRGGFAAYLQFIDGNAPGWSVEKLATMSEEEIHANASAYAEQLLGTATMRAEGLSKAAIQKTPLGRLVTPFWNEARGVYLSARQNFRDVARGGDKMVRAFKEGDTEGAYDAMYGAMGTSGRLLISVMMSSVIFNWAAGDNLFEEEEDEEPKSLGEDLSRAPRWALSRFTTLKGIGDMLGTGLFGNMTLNRTWIYAAGTNQAPSIPITKQAEESVTAFSDVPAYLWQAMAEDISWIDALKDLKVNEQKAVLDMITYGGAKLPLARMNETRKWLQQETGLSAGELVLMPVAVVIAIFNKFLEENDESELSREERFKRVLEMQEDERNGKVDTMRETVKTVRQVRDNLLANEGAVMSRGDYEILKFSESRGNWRATSDTSKAFGLYQFMPATWQDIMESPEGQREDLTKAGRVLENPHQQEVAVRILAGNHARLLRKAKVPVNLETIKFTHHFDGFNSVQGAIQVYGKGDPKPGQLYAGSPNKRIPKVLTSKVVKANPGLKKVKTAGDMRKYIRNLLSNARKDMRGKN